MEINEKKLKEILKGERQEFQKYVGIKLEKELVKQTHGLQKYVDVTKQGIGFSFLKPLTTARATAAGRY